MKNYNSNLIGCLERIQKKKTENDLLYIRYQHCVCPWCRRPTKTSNQTKKKTKKKGNGKLKMLKYTYIRSRVKARRTHVQNKYFSFPNLL